MASLGDTYIGSGVELRCTDCMDYMRSLPDKSFDVAIVDPPYGIHVSKRDLGGLSSKIYMGSWDDSIPDGSYFSELFRVSRHQIIWGANYFTSYLAGIMSWVVWDKSIPDSLSFGQGELAWTSFGGPLKIARIPYRGSVGADEVRIHPTQKPVKLYEWLLSRYVKPGMRVLDTHMGSGSSAIACLNAGLSFVGCELDPIHYEDAKNRFTFHSRQQRLF